MQKVGIFLVSKCLSAPAMIDAFLRSESYAPEFHVVAKQLNPFIKAHAKTHSVVPDLNLGDILKVANRLRGRIAFGLTDTEDFVTAGGRDLLEKEAGLEMVCVSKKYAVERSKADQRLLFDRIFKGANPRFKVFDPKDYAGTSDALADFGRTASEMDGVVIKPDAPARGAGVGVWGSDFSTKEEMSRFFLSTLARGRVVVEEKVEGEESSFHAFSDGKHFVPAPLTRDYKRSLDGNIGKLTGGMGSYRSPDGSLPFLSRAEVAALVRAEESAFRRWKGKGSEPGLKGIVLYDAIMHTARGFKVLERNSRGGNTEQVNLFATIEDDLVDVCHRILDGDLKGIRFASRASVVTCAVPLSYGLPHPAAPEGGKIGLARAYSLSEHGGTALKVYPMDVVLKGGQTYLGTSRSVAVTGVGASIEEARDISLQGVEALSGPLRWRRDVASREDISRSRRHLSLLRRTAC